MSIKATKSRLFGAACMLLAGIFALPTVSTIAAANPIDKLVGFWVLRDDDKIGSHQLSFRQVGDETHVEIDINLEIGIGFLTLFRYEHSNREVWRDGRLVELETKTDDDGEAYWVKAKATDKGLLVNGSSGSFLAPADIIPTSYWNMSTVAQSSLLDTQKGRLVEVAVAPAGQESVAVEGKIVPARRFQMSGDLELTLWYGPNDELMRIAFETRGSDIDYKRWPNDMAAQSAASR